MIGWALRTRNTLSTLRIFCDATLATWARAAKVQKPVLLRRRPVTAHNSDGDFAIGHLRHSSAHNKCSEFWRNCARHLTCGLWAMHFVRDQHNTATDSLPREDKMYIALGNMYLPISLSDRQAVKERPAAIVWRKDASSRSDTSSLGHGILYVQVAWQQFVLDSNGDIDLDCFTTNILLARCIARAPKETTQPTFERSNLLRSLACTSSKYVPTDSSNYTCDLSLLLSISE